MKKLTLFYLEDCPYCVKAKRALEELTAENPAYGGVEIDWIEESREPELADRYDYYHVPSIFVGEEKLYEAHVLQSYDSIKESVRKALDIAMA